MNVADLLKDVYNGEVVLPDFQRSFIWEPEDVRELLVSVLGDYFIGSMLVLEQFRDDSPFALRLVEGVSEINRAAKVQSIVKILLDGQQRTSALFYGLYEPSIPLKFKKSPHVFYLNIEKALSKSWDESVIAVSVNDKKSLSSLKKNGDIIPFSLLKDISGLADKFKDTPKFKEVINLANRFMNRQIHMIPLPRDTDLERIVETFERINRTGEPLSSFELLTAKLYKDHIKLRDLLDAAKERCSFLSAVAPEPVLKVVALLRGEEPKRRNILGLQPKDFGADWEWACEVLEIAYKRIMDTKNGYGVLDFKKWSPYTTMIVPLAAMISFVRTSKAETKANYDKIDYWYWASVFSNRYDQAADTASANDFRTFKGWVGNDKAVPNFILDFDTETIDLNVDRQSSAIYRGVMCMVALAGAFDFATGQAPQFDKEKVQDDHIFPKSIYNEHCVANRTLISTNLAKSDKKPSEYFKQKLDEHGEKRLKAILESHIVPEGALDCLLKNDIEGFKERRKQAIVGSLQGRLAGVPKGITNEVRKWWDSLDQDHVVPLGFTGRIVTLLWDECDEEEKALVEQKFAEASRSK